MTDGSTKSREGWLEIASAIVLSISALMTSWASYQASLWDGEQAAHYTLANARHMAAARLSTRAGQLQAVDIFMFSEWANAYVAGNTVLQAYYQARFRPEFAAAFKSWRAADPLRNPDAPPSPFADPKYQSAAERQSVELERQAVQLFKDGQSANSVSDHYVQAAVILASAMFFGGIGQVFQRPKVRLTLVAIAAVACIVATALILRLPAQSL